MAHLRDTYPEFFVANSSVDLTDIEGAGSYADLRGPADMNETDAQHYRDMSYKLNWDSSARFPWHGP